MANSTLMENISRDNHGHSSRTHDLVFVFSVCLVVIEILGLLCNGIILTVYYKYSRLRTATNLFILNLALCNLLLAVLQLMLSTPSFFNKEWQYGYNGCIAYGFVHQYLISVAVVTLAVIAFDRFCVITKPLRKLQTFIVTKPRAKVLICISHIYSFVFTFPLLVGWNELTPDKRYNTGCYIHYSNRSPSSMAYTIISTIFACLLPLVITACCYAKIYKSVRKSSRRCTQYNSKRNTVYKETGLRKKSLYHTRTARMISIVMFFFLLTWLPTRFTGLLAAFGCSVPPLAVYVCVFLTKSCVMYNAVVYVFLNHRFRAAFLHLTFVCREDSRLRPTTSATNASVRNLGEMLPSVVEGNDRLRVLSRKTLSQLSFMPAAEIAEFSSCSARNSNVDLSRPSRDPSETCREDSLNDRKSSLSDRHSSLPDRDLSEVLHEVSKQCKNLGVYATVGAVNGSCLNHGLQEEDLDGVKGCETEGVGPHLRDVGADTFEANDGLARTGIEPHLPAVGRDRSDTNNGSPRTGKNTTKYESSTAANNMPKINYGFNNPGLYQDDEYKKKDKTFEAYVELNISSLGNMA